MNPSNAFFESFVNLPHSVLGRKLQPLSLRHLLWLEKVKSPLFETTKEVTFKDLEAAVLICSSKNDSSLITNLEAHKLSFLKRVFLFAWCLGNKKRNLKKEIHSFLEYYDDYLAVPDFYDRTGERNDALPNFLLAAAALIQSTGWSEEVVFNMPVGKVVMLNIAFGYLASGQTNVISDKEHEAHRALTALTGGA